MDCMRSFSFLSSVAATVPVGATLAVWGASPRISWAYQRNSTGSTFNIQGFKNIDIHKIEVVGEMFTEFSGSNAVNIDNWIFYVQVLGQNPLVGANITSSPNDFSITYPATNPTFSLSKYSSSINFSDPIRSVSSIKLIDVRASGLSAQSLLNISIGWYMNFMVYYTFEGEDQEFAFL